MFDWFRNLLRTLEDLRGAVLAVVEAIHGLHTQSVDTSALETRLRAVELALDKREAEAEATLMRAEAKFKAARASEERARRLAESHEQSDEEIADEIREAYADAGFHLGNGEGSPEEGMPAMPSRLARRQESKSAAFMMKYGR